MLKSLEQTIQKKVQKQIQYLDWKIKYLKSNGMISALYLAQDIDLLTDLVTSTKQTDDELTNFVINECLAYMKMAFLPHLTKELLNEYEL